MRILHIGVNFYPEITGVGPLTTDMCRYLADRGHSVTAVVSAPHYPQWEVYPGYQNRLLARASFDDIELVRSYIYVPRQATPFKRVVYDSSFMLSSLVASLITRQHPDVIFTVCSPLQLGLSAYALSVLNRVPFVFHLQDLLPESAVALGMLTNPLVIKLSRLMGAFIYRQARLISAIGQGFIDTLSQRGVPSEKLRLIPNWVDTEWVRPLPRETRFRQELGLQSSDFVVMYVGNLGIKQGMETVLEAARMLVDVDDVQFVIVGDGTCADVLRNQAQAYRLPNFRMLGVQPKEHLPEMLASSDLLLLHQRKEVVDMVVPSKLLTYSASQRPILLAGVRESEGAKFVVQGNCGHVIEPEDPDLLANAVIDLKGSDAERTLLARNARAYVCAHFSREKVLADLESLLIEAVGI